MTKDEERQIKAVNVAILRFTQALASVYPKAAPVSTTPRIYGNCYFPSKKVR